jgi:uncharacterized protein (TIGR03118 family)
MSEHRLPLSAVAAAAAVVIGATTAAAATAPAQARAHRVGNAFREVKLVSDQAGRAATTDRNLVNAWGLAAAPTSPLWVSNNGTNTSTLYQGAKPGSAVTRLPLVVRIPGGAPTGVVFNPTHGFKLSTGGKSGSALFIFDSEGGDITAWNQSGNATKAVVTAHTTNAVYKGLAMAASGGSHFLLAADFHDNRIDVFDQAFHRVMRPKAFPSQNIPSGYAPFDVATLGGRVYVTYAKQDPARTDDVAGPGHGFINVFTQSGQFLRTLVRRGALDSPWGLAIAPRGFGPYAGKLLVGNFGDGRIHVVDRKTGSVLATLQNAMHKPIVIDGLWALYLGNGTAGARSDVWFSSGPANESHGLLGILR